MDMKTLLIVDSLEIDRSVLSAMLSSRYQVLEAPDGESALEFLASNFESVDIVLLAFELDGMSGIATLGKMHELGYLEAIPVLMLTLETTTGLMGNAYALGALDFISRPFDMQVVQHRLSNALATGALRQGVKKRGFELPSPDSEVLEHELALLSAKSARMSTEIDQIRRMFTKLTDEMWFQYRFEPATLIANPKLQALIDVPLMTSDPLGNSMTSEAAREFLRYVLSRFEGLAPGERYFEIVVPAKLVSSNHRLLVKGGSLVAHDGERAMTTGIVARVIDIEGEVSALERAALDTNRIVASVLEGSGNDEEGAVGVKALMACLGQVFDVVRVVDPAICAQVSLGAGEVEATRHDRCFDVWGKSQRCVDCVSARVSKELPRANKFESIGGEVFYIISSYLELAGRGYALECVSRIDDNVSGLAEAASERHLLSLAEYNSRLHQDPVSGAFSRSYWNDRASVLEGRYAVAVVDIDNFKMINDQLGHLWGDRALRMLVQALSACTRPVDRIVRYGGDEFVVILSGMEEASMESRLSAMIEKVGCVHIGDDGEVSLQVSIGAVCGKGKVAEMFKAADAALYKAKQTKGCLVAGTWNGE